ncbi:DUF1643 domain-containing protein [Streptomyces sp.]|uniref:DUF1643 domain-containing protein n=1 Tax=Streptomyces sp. TaxID=1931 RepID=UPI002F40439B
MSAPAAPDVLDPPAGIVLEEEHDLAGNYASAVFDTDGIYRYLLTRVWDPARPLACWIMLNPSTADATTTDPTLTRVVRFTADAGCGGLAIVNLFALRSTDPRHLHHHPDPVGPHNDLFIRHAARTTNGGPVIAAWGAQGTLHNRHTRILSLLAEAGITADCYGTTGAPSGHQPRHDTKETHVTTYRIEFGKVGTANPVPELTLTEDDPNQFARAVAAHAIPYLTPVLAGLGHPEYVDCFFRVSPDRSMGEFWWLDLTTGKGTRFCPARITAIAA